ncbi:MAG: AAA family ATPase [Euryarchaeota archaeon]|nr:AAA family ATPase [Euryarchaeota archaeon]
MAYATNTSGPLLGRARERAIVIRALEEAKERKGRIILWAGPQGIGKTRLLRACAELSRSRGYRVLWGSCPEVSCEPYRPFRQAFSALTRPKEAAADGAGAAVEPGATSPIPLPRGRSLEESPATVVASGCLAALDPAKLGGVPVILLDDLQWADPGTLAVLKLLGAGISERPLLVLGAYAPELSENRTLSSRPTNAGPSSTPGEATPDPSAPQTLAKVEAQREKLEPLGAETAPSLVRSLRSHEVAPTTPELQQLFATAEGNPLFVLELLRARQRERRSVAEIMEGPRTRASASSQVPQVIRRPIERRLARMMEADRALLEAAVVLGSDFTSEEVDALISPAHAPGGDQLEELSRYHGLVERIRPGLWGFENSFVPRVVREEAPGTALRRYHRRAAEHLAATRPDRVELIALHFFDARAAKEGLPWVRKSLDRAIAREEGTEVVRYARWGQELLPLLPAADPEVGAWMVKEGEGWRLMGNLHAAENLWHQASVKSVGLDRVRAFLFLASVQSAAGKKGDAERSLASAKGTPVPEGDRAEAERLLSTWTAAAAPTA